MVDGLRLLAQDAEDLQIISACLQDALLHVGEMTYQASKRRFVAALNRFRWERAQRNSRGDKRVRAGLHFDGVLGVKALGLDFGNKEQLLQLMSIDCVPGEDGTARITLRFAGGAAARLEVECIECTLIDLGAPWSTHNRPRHDAGEGTGS